MEARLNLPGWSPQAQGGTPCGGTPPDAGTHPRRRDALAALAVHWDGRHRRGSSRSTGGHSGPHTPAACTFLPRMKPTTGGSGPCKDAAGAVVSAHEGITWREGCGLSSWTGHSGSKLQPQCGPGQVSYHRGRCWEGTGRESPQHPVRSRVLTWRRRVRVEQSGCPLPPSLGEREAWPEAARGPSGVSPATGHCWASGPCSRHLDGHGRHMHAGPAVQRSPRDGSIRDNSSKRGKVGVLPEDWRGALSTFKNLIRCGQTAHAPPSQGRAGGRQMPFSHGGQETRKGRDFG